MALGARLGRALRADLHHQTHHGSAVQPARDSKGSATLVFLHGDLGMGKTTLVRGMLRGLGYQGPVRSPTYTLIEPYEFDGWVLYHLDLYRLGDPEELEYLGLRDLLATPGLLVIEWPERASALLPTPDLSLWLHPAEVGRSIRIQASGDGSESLAKIAF